LANDILQELGRGNLQLIIWSLITFNGRGGILNSRLCILYRLVIFVSLLLLSLVCDAGLRASWRAKRGMTQWGDFF
jgi:hypothetical protein